MIIHSSGNPEQVVGYSNLSELREKLRVALVILLEGASQGEEPGSSADREVCSATQWWSLRDRFSPEDLQTMIDLYTSGTTVRQVVERFGVSVRSVTRLLRKCGVRRDQVGR